MPFADSLSPELLLAAYRGGYFPMPDPDTEEILWFNPDPRAIIPLDQFHVSRSLRRTAKKGLFEISFDRNFAGVIEGCADRPATWISADIKRAYLRLFELGFGHSVEVWGDDGTLLGGLYGLSQGGVFHAESMFSRSKDASKIALWALTGRMKDCGLSLLEVQFMTPHLKSLGAVNISKNKYIQLLTGCLQSQSVFKPTADFYNLG
jgi:leucyl/phenylalanyl-tRNA--protein transferase